IWEPILVWYVRLGQKTTFSLTIDERGVQKEWCGQTKTYLWKDIVDTRLDRIPHGKIDSSHLQILLRGQPEGYRDEWNIAGPGLNVFRLQETIRKGMRMWGHV